MKSTLQLLGVASFFGVCLTAGLLGLAATKVQEAIKGKQVQSPC